MNAHSDSPRKLLLIVATILAMTFAALPASATKPPAVVEMDLSVDESALASDRDATLTLVAVPIVDIRKARFEFSVAYGDGRISGTVAEDLGDIVAGVSYTITSRLALTGLGKVEVRVTALGVDTSSGTLFRRATCLYVVSSGDQVSSSNEGYIPAHLDALKRRATNGGLTKSALDDEVHRAMTGGAKTEVIAGKQGKQAGIGIQGTASWTDSGGSTHPARNVTVEVHDAADASPDPLATTTASAFDGSFGFFGIDDSPEELRDIFIRIKATSAFATIKGASGGNIHAVDSDTAEDVEDGGFRFFGVVANNTDDNAQAFSVHDGLVLIIGYADNFGAIPRIDTIFPGTGTFFRPATSEIHLVKGDWPDWDIIGHEYTHYFQRQKAISASPGGGHAILQNMAETLTKDNGVRLAWSEGHATHFGIAAQIDQGASSLGVPEVGDTAYIDTIDGGGFTYDMEINDSKGEGTGEDNELSVQRILWDIYDGPADANDQVATSNFTLTSLMIDNTVVTLSQFWNALTATTDTRQDVTYGCIFGDHNVAPELTAPADGAEFLSVDPPPAFRWIRNGAGPSNRLNKFTVEFWNEDFTSNIFTSPEVDDPMFTPTDEQWDTILAGGDVIKWVVRGRNTTAAETGTYVSCDRTIGGVDVGFVIDTTGSMGQEIDGIKAALTAFVTALEEEEITPSINIVTFDDSPFSRIISDDLVAIQAEVDSLFAGGGGDCPEGSVEALNLAAKNVRAGGRILFATDADAHDGLNIPATIAALRGKGIRVDVLLSASCSIFKELGNCNDADCAGDQLDKTVGTCDLPVCDDPIVYPPDYPTDAVVVFSAIAAESGGVFAFIPEVNRGDPTRFNNVALNAMLGTVFPGILDLNPAKGAPNSTLNVVFTGSNTNFNGESTVAFGGTGIAVNSTETLSATSLRANVSIAEDAGQSFRDVTVTTTLGDDSIEEATGTGAFEVEISFVSDLTSLFPSSGAIGDTLNVVVTAFLSNFDETTTIDFGTGVTVNSFTPNSATEGIANITITGSAAPGFHQVTIGGDFGTIFDSSPGSFLVTSADLAEGFPRIVTVTPNIASPGGNATITVVGENTTFEDGVSFGTVSGEGVTVDTTTVNSATVAELEITVSPDAPTSFRDLSVTTGGEVATALNALEIGNSPPVADAGDDQLITVTSTGTTDVTLDGSGSTDPGGITAYVWTGTPDPADVAAPTLTGLTPGEYVFTLVVTDDLDADSEPDQVTVTVNGAPVADAGDDQTITLEGDTATVTLNGSASADPNKTVTGYTWTGTPDPDDVASPQVELGPGVFTFTLAVTDNRGATSLPDSVTVTVNEIAIDRCGTASAPSSWPDGGRGDGLLLVLTATAFAMLGWRRQKSR